MRNFTYLMTVLLFGYHFFSFGQTGQKTGISEKSSSLQAILDKTVDNKKIFGTSFAIMHNGESWTGAAGNMSNEQQYFIASTTKLYVTAIILHFQANGKLKLEDKISKYLDKNIVQGLHQYKGSDYSDEITIKHLLSHTSGLPDYFEDERKGENSLLREILMGNDRLWTFEESINVSKSLKPQFRPGQKNKAYYSDTNFQLLGKIIESVSKKSFSENLDEVICKPLKLTQTYLFSDTLDSRPKPLYYKAGELHTPKAMSSFGPDGGMVSTSGELIKFLDAFFNGKFFPKSYIVELKEWNKIFFPMQSGVGIHRIKLSRLSDPMGSIPELMGHSGLSGALAYYSPSENLFIAGTVNQIAHPDISFKTTLKLIRKTLSKK